MKRLEFQRHDSGPQTWHLTWWPRHRNPRWGIVGHRSSEKREWGRRGSPTAVVWWFGRVAFVRNRRWKSEREATHED